MRGARHGEPAVAGAVPEQGPVSGFWARRRAAVAQEARRGAAGARGSAVGPEAEAAVEGAEAGRAEAGREDALPERPEAEILAALGLPDPDAMGAGDDFAAFMARAVPEALRRRALRRLWTSRPVLANLDRLVDYDDDYTGGGVPMGTLPTAYRVGRGLLGHVERLAEATGGAAGGAGEAHGPAGGAGPSAGRALAPGDATADAASPLPAGPSRTRVVVGGEVEAAPAAGRDAEADRGRAIGGAPTVRPTSPGSSGAGACQDAGPARDAPAGLAARNTAARPDNAATAATAGTAAPAATAGTAAPALGSPVRPASFEDAAPLPAHPAPAPAASARRMRFEFA